MVAYYVVGGLGVALLLVSLVAGDVLPHHALESLDVADGYLSTAAIGGFAGAFGLAGGVAAALGSPGWLAMVVGVVVGAAVGAGAGWLVRSLKSAPEHQTPTSTDVLGVEAVVVSPIPVGGYGEVSITVRGVRRKLSALADRPFSAGQPVRVTHTLSPTSVRVTGVAADPMSSPQDAV